MNRSKIANKRIGVRSGKLLVIANDGINHSREPMVLVKCDCGNTKKVIWWSVKYGKTLSCGCYNKEMTSKSKKSHGLSNKHQLYFKWKAIKTRCHNRNTKDWDNYGGRGILMSEYWASDFQKFYDWAIDNGWKKGLDIDRIDNNCGYYPENCRFITRSANSRNKRNNVLVLYKNETKTLVEWCEVLKIKYKSAHNRIRLGWSIWDTFNTPVRPINNCKKQSIA